MGVTRARAKWPARAERSSKKTEGNAEYLEISARGFSRSEKEKKRSSTCPRAWGRTVCPSDRRCWAKGNNGRDCTSLPPVVEKWGRERSTSLSPMWFFFLSFLIPYFSLFLFIFLSFSSFLDGKKEKEEGRGPQARAPCVRAQVYPLCFVLQRISL